MLHNFIHPKFQQKGVVASLRGNKKIILPEGEVLYNNINQAMYSNFSA